MSAAPAKWRSCAGLWAADSSNDESFAHRAPKRRLALVSDGLHAVKRDLTIPDLFTLQGLKVKSGCMTNWPSEANRPRMSCKAKM